jgi:hypothetical protein
MKTKSELISCCTIEGLMPPTTTVDDTNNLGEGDSYLVLDLLPENENWMEKLKQEVQFRVMLHRGAVDISTFNIYIFHFLWVL